MLIDTASVLVELRGLIASKPSHGRQELLTALAELEVEHRIPEDELDRALRLAIPQFVDDLLNRGPDIADVLRGALSEDAPASHRNGDAQGVHHSIAA